MKKILALSLAFSAVVFTASAQEQRAKQADQQGQHQRRGGDQMMKDLNLTEAQKTQMKANREEAKQKMDALKNDKSLSDADLKTRRAALMQEQKQKMESILTADQKAKMAASRAQWEGKKGDMKGDKGKMKGDRGQMHAKRAEEMKAKLGLSDDQSAKLKAQHEATKAQMQAIKNDNSLSKEARKEKMKAIKENAKTQRNNILTADQQKKMDEFKKEGHKKAGKKKGLDVKK
ncbi:MAG: hypothetical protein JWQ27_2037 [Ferruginibacter sp.]|nr:hypothetical protein [Ferruginibacter sp.]